jgi:hypothetical protein
LSKIIRGFVTLLMAVGLSVAVATPAHAATSCWGTTCNGLDPSAEGCAADAKTIDNAYTPGGEVHVELRYSSACFATWTRYTWGTNFFTNTAFIRGESHTYSKSPGYVGDQGWTKMVSYTEMVKSCIQWYKPNLGYFENCTAQH